MIYLQSILFKFITKTIIYQDYPSFYFVFLLYWYCYDWKKLNFFHCHMIVCFLFLSYLSSISIIANRFAYALPFCLLRGSLFRFQMSSSNIFEIFRVWFSDSFSPLELVKVSNISLIENGSIFDEFGSIWALLIFLRFLEYDFQIQRPWISL